MAGTARRRVKHQAPARQEEEEAQALPERGCSSDNDEEDGDAPQATTAAATRPGMRRSFADMLGSAVDDAELRQAYRALPAQRSSARKQLLDALETQGPRWHLLLRSGFSVLVHGLGSKRELLQWVAEQHLTDGAVVCCNGWVKGLTAHKVLASAAGALLGRSCRNLSSSEILAQMRKEAEDWPDRHVYVVLHSIDGAGLRNEESQALLASMAACANCHLLASVNHVNAALLWNSATAASFRWVWTQAHTYAPLAAETLDVPSALLGCFQRSRQRSAGAVLKSFNATARAIYRLVVEAQLEDAELEGMDFKQLHLKSRQSFLLSDEGAVRAVLTEFLDHEMLSTRRSSEGGGDLFYVPLDRAGLEQAARELDALGADVAA